MKYMIVIWTTNDEGDGEWQILHYSHKIDDVRKWFEYYRSFYATCQLMVDYTEATSAESKQDVLAAFASFLDGLI